MNHSATHFRAMTLLSALALLGLDTSLSAQEAPPADSQAPADSELNEVVVTGYTTQRKKDIVGAVSVADLGEIADRPPGSILQSLQGEIPGVQISTDGNPSAKSSVLIRG